MRTPLCLPADEVASIVERSAPVAALRKEWDMPEDVPPRQARGMRRWCRGSSQFGLFGVFGIGQVWGYV